MPDTFFIGDHMNMFPHMLEKVMVQTEEDEAFSDNSIVLNGIKLDSIKGHTTVKVSVFYALTF